MNATLTLRIIALLLTLSGPVLYNVFMLHGAVYLLTLFGVSFLFFLDAKGKKNKRS